MTDKIEGDRFSVVVTVVTIDKLEGDRSPKPLMETILVLFALLESEGRRMAYINSMCARAISKDVIGESLSKFSGSKPIGGRGSAIALVLELS